MIEHERRGRIEHNRGAQQNNRQLGLACMQRWIIVLVFQYCLLPSILKRKKFPCWEAVSIQKTKSVDAGWSGVHFLLSLTEPWLLFHSAYLTTPTSVRRMMGRKGISTGEIPPKQICLVPSKSQSFRLLRNRKNKQKKTWYPEIPSLSFWLEGYK